MQKFKILLVSLSLAASAAITASTAVADEIVIYKNSSSERCTYYVQTWHDQGTDETVPGSTGRYTNRVTSYIILNKTTGEYREVTYFTYQKFNEEKQRYQRAKGFTFNTDYADADSGYTPEMLFELDPNARRNNLILSFDGSGMDNNHYNDFEDSGDQFSHDSLGVNAETLAGAIRLQKIRNDFGTVECYAPSSLTGEIVSEDQDNYVDDSHTREYCRGKRSLRLDKARTRDFLDMEGTTLEDAEAAVTYYLMSRGYDDLTTPPPT